MLKANSPATPVELDVAGTVDGTINWLNLPRAGALLPICVPSIEPPLIDIPVDVRAAAVDVNLVNAADDFAELPIGTPSIDPALTLKLVDAATNAVEFSGANVPSAATELPIGSGDAQSLPCKESASEILGGVT